MPLGWLRLHPRANLPPRATRRAAGPLSPAPFQQPRPPQVLMLHPRHGRGPAPLPSGSAFIPALPSRGPLSSAPFQQPPLAQVPAPHSAASQRTPPLNRPRPSAAGHAHTEVPAPPPSGSAFGPARPAASALLTPRGPAWVLPGLRRGWPVSGPGSRSRAAAQVLPPPLPCTSPADPSLAPAAHPASQLHSSPCPPSFSTAIFRVSPSAGAERRQVTPPFPRIDWPPFGPADREAAGASRGATRSRHAETGRGFWLGVTRPAWPRTVPADAAVGDHQSGRGRLREQGTSR